MRSINDFVSQRANAVDASGIRKVFDLAAKMKDPINLSIGLPDFDVPDPAKESAIHAIRTGQNRYTQTQGIAPLRDKIRAALSAEIGRDTGDVLITSGVSGGLLLAILSVINPGDEVIFLDPYFVMYKHLVTVAGGVSVPVNSYPDFRFPADKVEAAITPRTKMLMLNSPCNPTGYVMSEEEVKQAVEIARKHDLLLLSDEIYEPFLYESGQWAVGSGQVRNAQGTQVEDTYTLKHSSNADAASAHSTAHSRLPSPARLYDRTILLRGFSKSHAMTGWRLGYAAGPAEIINQMTKLQQYTFVCAPAPLQHAALAVFDLPMTDAVAAYQRKRDIAYDLLSKKFEVEKPGGAFYIFPQSPAGVTATDFCAKAIENNVLIIPGNVFSDQDTHFRISYATTDEKLAEGCKILGGLV